MARLAQVCIRLQNIFQDDHIEFLIRGNLVRFTAVAAPDPAVPTQFQYGSGEQQLSTSFKTALDAYLVQAGVASQFESWVETVPFWVDYGNGEGETVSQYAVNLKAKTYGSINNFGSVSIQTSGQVTLIGQRTNDNPPTISEQVSEQYCISGATGAITLTVSGGTAPYAYLWNDGATTKDRTLLESGLYSVRVTDSTQNTVLFEGDAFEVIKNSGDHPGVSNKDINVGILPPIAVVGTVDDDSITLSVSGGVAPYTFLWSDGSTEQNRTGLGAGRYSVTVTDSVGCSMSFQFTLVDANRFYFSGNPILLDMQADNFETKPNLTFLCEVWVEQEYLSGVFEKVADLEHPADSQGKTRFDVSVFLRPYLKPHFPEPGQNTVTRADGVFKRFYLRYQEKFGTPATISDFTVVETRFVVLGGLGFEEADGSRFFSEVLPTQLPFLSWWPVVKEVTGDQPEFLYLMLHTGNVSSFRVIVERVADGYTYDWPAYFQYDVNRFEIYCIPVGLRALGFEPGEEVTEYRVWCVNQNGDLISEIRTYVDDSRYHEKRRYFLYSNSLGGVNTLACTGLAEVTAEVKTETLERLLNAGYNPALGDTEVSEAVSTSVMALSTGYFDSQAELEALTDFALSKEVRLLDAGRYRAGRVQARKLKTLDEDEDVKYLDFEFVLPSENYYTPKL